MTTTAEVLALMHQRTHGAATPTGILGMRLTLADILAILELCGVVKKP
jgi:hypothetical protein